MSKKANPTAVGGFVLVGLAMVIAAFFALGDFQLNKEDRLRCVTFFSGSLYGLDPGAPVTFRGVTIGRVSSVQIDFDPSERNYIIPVYIELTQTDVLSGGGRGSGDTEAIRKKLNMLIEHGLRAKLKTSSLLTGKLYIELAFQPGSELRLHNKDTSVLEIPTLASGLEQIADKIEALPLNEIIAKTSIALENISEILDSENTRQVISSLGSNMEKAGHFLDAANKELPDVVVEAKKTLSGINSLISSTNALLQSGAKELDMKPLVTNLAEITRTLDRTLKNLEQLTSKDSMFSYQIGSSLQEIERAAVSVRQLTDYLQRHPNALVFGQEKEKP
ncbi:MAG: MlaD family protein [Desulfobulbus sp.]